MEKIISVDNLKARILVLESRLEAEEAALKIQFHKLQELLKPANLIKTAAKDLVQSFEVNGSVVDMIVSWAAGHLSKKMVVGNSSGTFKNVLGNLVEAVVTGGLAKNADTIKSTVMDVIGKFSKKKSSETKGETNPENE